MISGSTDCPASPMISSVTCSAEQGMAQPSLVSKARQSDRSFIMSYLQFFDRIKKIFGFLELPVNAGEAHVGDLIQVAQSFHHALADGHAGHLALVLVRQGG